MDIGCDGYSIGNAGQVSFSVNDRNLHLLLCFRNESMYVAELGCIPFEKEIFLDHIKVDDCDSIYYPSERAYKSVYDECCERLQEVANRYSEYGVNIDVDRELRLFYMDDIDLFRGFLDFLDEVYIGFKKDQCDVDQGSRLVFSINVTFNKKFYRAVELALYAEEFEYSDDNSILYVVFNSNQVDEISAMYFNIIGDFDKDTKAFGEIRRYLKHRCLSYRVVKLINEYLSNYRKNHGYSSKHTNSILVRIIKDINKDYREKLDDIYERYVSRGLRVVKWGSEYRLYSLVKSFLPKAVFQYRPEWLEGQSFDIYLPDYNIAIEYQGKQHYEALDYFGGEAGYLDNLQRDQKKRVLSKQYNVDVLEWKYDSRMSRESVRQFLLKAGIDVLLIE